MVLRLSHKQEIVSSSLTPATISPVSLSGMEGSTGVQRGFIIPGNCQISGAGTVRVGRPLPWIASLNGEALDRQLREYGS